MATGDSNVLDRRALNRSLLVRQMLTERVDATPAAVITRLVGMQAQAPDPPYIGLWTRLSGFVPEDLAGPVRGREAVRVALMRGTIHLVTADDCLTLRPVLADALAQGLKGTFGRKLEGLDLAEVAELGRKLVEEEPLTLGGLGVRLAERWSGRDPSALANAVRNLTPLVQVPPRGLWGESGRAVHTTAESWLGRPLAAGVSPDSMVERYLAAFGPASVKDIQVWSGMTRIAETVRRLRPRLRSFRDENGVELLDVLNAPLPDRDLPVPVRYLPEFDNILLSHADRSRILTEEQHRLVFTRNGLIRATFLLDGFVRGIWRIEQQRKGAVLVLEPFASLTKKEREVLVQEGEDLLAFLTAPDGARSVRFD
ncbi:winged helix DNA-binding domain-containing protein [Streptomyces sp. NPDC057325]|uniref:winged helix DNA-binding domain-containing protein n=1 Tax=unclassified Streptomyces TaxID=2593676 RepID=UPI00362691BA